MIRKSWVYYLLSFTWGLVMSLIGCLTSLVLIILGYKPQKFVYGWYFAVGDNWGGVDLGPCFIVSKSSSTHTKYHEFGHSVQNCIYGPFMLILVSIPSAIRYWYRVFKYYRKGKRPPTKYESVWFEQQATNLGTIYYAYL